MTKKTNYLLGHGENLTGPIQLVKGGGPTKAPYTFAEAKERLLPQVSKAAALIAELPAAACPRDFAVGVMTLHPEYIAKSYHPGRLLDATGLHAIGSRPAKVAPEKWRPKAERVKSPRPSPSEAEGVELFVAGKRSNFISWAESLPRWAEGSEGATELFEVEAFRAAGAADSVRPLRSDAPTPLLEIVLHVPDPFVIDGFEEYLKLFNLKADLDRRYEAGSLCFLPLRSPRELIKEIGRFSFLRVLREMPRLRPLRPLSRSFPGLQPFQVTLPQEAPLAPHVNAVIFDGGVPATSGLDRWVTSLDGTNARDAVVEFQEHGLAVTSALLFGTLQPGGVLPRPYAHVDHIRVLDTESGTDEDLYDVLPRIRTVLQSRKHEFANLSIGPELPIEDDDVHAWTVMLDEALAGGAMLAAVAVGNSGHLDRASGNARIQVPSDSVNALAVGACDRTGEGWRRASYSSLGPGRSPGVVKPDVLSFGGWDGEPYWTLDALNPGSAGPTFGTSFAAPSVLRMALGVRAHFGDVLSPLALRALLLHSADDGEHERHEVGWGRVPDDLAELVECPDGMVRVVYQGTLTPAEATRVSIPIPTEPLKGRVTIHATMCFASNIDPAHPSNYTRSGVEVFVRPHADKRNKKAIHPKTTAFFQARNYSKESELRRDAHKWETVLNRKRSFQAASLKDPALDIYYHAREESQATSGGQKMRYALVITVRAPSVVDLYDRIVRRYQARLTPLLPVIQIPVRA